jgi:hypothetical protein
MQKLIKLLGLLALVATPINHASAAMITEDLSFFFSSSAPFTIEPFNLAFQSGSSGNLLSSFTPAASYGPGSGTVFSEIVTLNTLQTYTLSFTAAIPGGFFVGGGSIIPSGSFQSLASVGGSFPPNTPYFAAGVTLSPVPLPASLPLFALALLSLIAIGYGVTQTKQSSSTLNSEAA